MVRRKRARTCDDLHKLRDEIEAHKRQAKKVLDEILLDEFNRLKIKFEHATWDAAKNKAGKPIKRALKLGDFEDLGLFHWGYEFDEVLNKSGGGFEAIVTNPPWEVFQTDEKEFFQEYVPTIQKKELRIEEWKKQRAELMRDPTLQKAWLEYASPFSFVSKYFKKAAQYKNQISIVNGRNVGSKINLYSYFLEQCYNLLKNEGQCGIVIPSGMYTDLGATGLRHLLFNETKMTGLFCFENRKNIFEGVHRNFKFVVLSFEKGGKTNDFPAAFMRHDVNELARFPQKWALWIKTDLIRRLSPSSHSVMELKNDRDVNIADKMLKFPLLGEKIEGVWNLALSTEFNSFVVDAFIRQKVTAHCNMFYVYQLPIPRLSEKDSDFAPIVTRAAKLICTTEFSLSCTSNLHKRVKPARDDPVDR